MAYFPFFMELEGRSALIIGGGVVALRKAEKLLPYGPHITVLAPEICPELRQLQGLTLREQAYTPAALEQADLVIAATDDRELNHSVSRLCRERRIPVNVVDCREDCSFLFPSLVKEGDLSIGISTGGASPTAAIALKERIRELIPENMEEILCFLEAQRPGLKQAFPEESKRAGLFRALFEECMKQGRALTEQEVEALCGGKTDGE